MKKIFVLGLAGLLIVMAPGVSLAQVMTKKELQFKLKEMITDEEFEMMLKIRESTGRNWVDIFDNTIEPMREVEIYSNESSRKYILPQKGPEEKPIEVLPTEPPAEKKDKLSIEVNAAPVFRETDVKPVQVKQDEEKQRKRAIYPRAYEYKERLKDARAAEEAAAATEATDESGAPAGGEEEKTLREKLREIRTLEKRRKIVDRKPALYRSYDRRKKVEDYNRTGKPNRFGGTRVDEEFEDRGFSTRAFKPKQFGSKILYEEDLETNTEE